jgi:hypothetical protein
MRGGRSAVLVCVLGLVGALVGCGDTQALVERARVAPLIVVDAPRFDNGPRVLDRRELVDVQALVAQAAIERLDEGVLQRFCQGRMR